MRARRADDGSLELLLDTITNTFGGILFLAILVALLVRTTSPRNEQPVSQGEPMSATELATLEVRVKELEAAIAVLKRRASEPSARSSAGEPKQLGLLSEAMTRLESALRERASSQQETARLQLAAEAARAQLADLDGRRDTAEKQFADAVARRDEARAEAAELTHAALQVDKPPGAAVLEQTVGLPRIRPTAKDEVGIYIRFGRVYMMHHWERGERLGPNTAQFIVLPGPPQVARPKPAAGLVIDSPSIDQDVDRLLAPFPSQRFYVTCVVFDDSFDVFQVLKATLVKKGFEYRLIPRRPGQPVFDSGGSGEAQ